MVNTGRLDETGRVEDPAATLERWLEEVQAWEQSTGQRMELWAWLSAKTFRTNIRDETVQASIAAEARRLLSVKSPGGRGFDGVITDIEPVGYDRQRYEAYLRLVDRIRQAVGDGRPVGVAAPRYSPEPPTQWFWGPDEFQRMALRADFIVVNTYNTALGSRAVLGATGEDYADWIAGQARAILAAVSGRHWNPRRPPPRPGFRLYLSAPAYPPLVHESGSVSHDPGIENTRYAVRGIRRGLEEVRRDDPEAARYLAGIALYGHTDGTGGDGYAATDRDWAWWDAEMGRDATDPAAAGRAPRNAAWLGHAWLVGPREPAAQMLDRLHASGVRYLLVNMGLMDPRGNVPARAAEIRRLLTDVQAWERSRGERFILWAWFPARTNVTDIRRHDVQEQIAREAERVLAARGPGGRRLEGIVMGFWPVGLRRDILGAYMGLLDRVHRSVGWKTPLGVATPRYSADPPSVWYWGPVEFYYMGRHADFLVVNTYNSGLRSDAGATEASYEAWIQDQVRGVLAAVSGEYGLQARPGPRPHVRVFFSAPAYPPQDGGAGTAGQPRHDPAVETAGAAARAVRRALRDLAAAGKAEQVRLAGGMAMYAHTDGTGADGYAAYDRDWAAWNREMGPSGVLP